MQPTKSATKKTSLVDRLISEQKTTKGASAQAKAFETPLKQSRPQTAATKTSTAKPGKRISFVVTVLSRCSRRRKTYVTDEGA